MHNVLLIFDKQKTELWKLSLLIFYRFWPFEPHFRIKCFPKKCVYMFVIGELLAVPATETFQTFSQFQYPRLNTLLHTHNILPMHYPVPFPIVDVHNQCSGFLAMDLQKF